MIIFAGDGTLANGRWLTIEPVRHDPIRIDYCTANPTADSIPAAVTGRATVYEWACKDGKPEVVKQLFKINSQGYLADFWHELTPE